MFIKSYFTKSTKEILELEHKVQLVHMLSPTRMMMSYFCQHIYSPSHLLSYIHLLPVSLSFFLLADSLSLFFFPFGSLG